MFLTFLYASVENMDELLMISFFHSDLKTKIMIMISPRTMSKGLEALP